MSQVMTSRESAQTQDSRGTPVIEVRGVHKIYDLGEVQVPALRGVDCVISQGEFVAIMGASGGGKSTFMNLIGGLDRPTRGLYKLDGVDVSTLDKTELAHIRNQKIGFVFQGFNLLSRTTALENVELPALYARMPVAERRQRAREVLRIVGLAEREDHYPSQLSGGQQQRVAIARALMNRPALLLADEPTGNLDSRTSIEIMAIFQRLNREHGITIVLVTHEPDIAQFASRRVYFKDGRIRRNELVAHPEDAEEVLKALPPNGAGELSHGSPLRPARRHAGADAQQNAFRAHHAGHHHRRGGGDCHGGRRPGRQRAGPVVYNANNWGTHINGTEPSYFAIRDWQFDQGAGFTAQDITDANNVAVLGATVVNNLFPDGADPVGKSIRIKNLPFKVVGTLIAKGQSGMGQDQDDMVYVPYTTLNRKITGNYWLSNIAVSAVSNQATAAAQQQIADLLRSRHRIRAGQPDDFAVMNLAAYADVANESAQIMTILLASIASVSLLVGGIGIMNIMLVSVTERTREIGIRMAVGATEADVQRQFLIEALVLALAGGAIGIFFGLATSWIISAIAQWPVDVSPVSIVVAALFSAAVGIFFGFYPAKKAAHLDPIEALRFE